MPAIAAEAAMRKTRQGTAEKLVRAAVDEFNEHGFDGTDTNRIARRAGFAPQTFYRWFADKTEIFIKAYEAWQRQEAMLLRSLLAENAADSRLVKACVEHHRAHRVFRRSLRRLSLENDKVRSARAASRLRQIAFIQGWQGKRPLDEARLAVMLLQIERLADALAEGELSDMGLSQKAAEAALASIIHDLRHPA